MIVTVASQLILGESTTLVQIAGLIIILSRGWMVAK